MADPNFDSMTDEQLEQAFKEAAVQPPIVIPDQEPQAPEAVTEPEPEAPPAEETPQAEPEAPAEPENLEAERYRLLAEEMEARAKHWESVAGRNAGKFGYLETQLKAIQAAQQQPRQEYADTGEPEQRPTPPQPPGRDALAAWAVQQAVSQTFQGFEASHQDSKDMQDKMAEYIKTSGFDLQSIMTLDNPIEAQREVSRVLDEAYWHTKAEHTAARRAELTAKREAMQSQAAEKKMKASVSATGSVPPPKPKAKTVDEMTDEELEKEMVRVQGGRW